MDRKAPTIQELRKQLGSEYSICTIDWEQCIYRDFGNGFNVEVSGANSRRKGKKVALYLWHGTEPLNCMIVRTVHNVERSAEAISKAVEELKAYTDTLILRGYNNRDAIFHMLHPKSRRN